MLASFNSECTMSTRMAAASMANPFFLLPNSQLLNTALLSSSLGSSSATTFLIAWFNQLSRGIFRYNVTFV